MKTSDLSQAQDRILGKAHALGDPKLLLGTTDFGKIITRNLPHRVALASILSLNDYPATTPMHWGKPMQPGAQ